MATQTALQSSNMTRWLMSVHETPGNGPCRGDSYAGHGNYTANGLCPNGLKWTNWPAAERWYRERLERAKADIQTYDTDFAVSSGAVAVTPEDVALIPLIWSMVYE